MTTRIDAKLGGAGFSRRGPLVPPSALAIRTRQSAARVGQAIVPAGGLQAAVDTEQAAYAVRTYFSGFVSCIHPWREAREIRLETRRRAEARLQPGLAAPRKAKPVRGTLVPLFRWRTEVRRRLKSAPQELSMRPWHESMKARTLK